MLRQVFVIKGNKAIYQRVYGNALNSSDIENLFFKIMEEGKANLDEATGCFDYIKYRIAYTIDHEHNLIFLFITGLTDDFYRSIKIQLTNFKEQFINWFSEELKHTDIKNLNYKRMNIILDELHAHLKPKIALVGFAGVGKTTIKKLIKLDEIPLQHVPTITGEIATIKIGRLFFKLFDFAGQEQFKFLWKSFIKESDAVLIVTDSTVDNVEESKFFIDLKSREVPYARAAIIGNKQDLSNALSIDGIETITGIRTYPMIANRKENRNKMIRIIADVLDMSTADSPLLKELFESTDLSSETLFGKDETPLPQIDSSIISEDGSVNLTQNEENLVEKTVEVKSTKERVEEIITKSVDQKPMLITKGRWKKQRLDTPIIDGLINAELYKEIVNSDSFTLNEALSILFTIINCVYLTKTKPKEYPKFSSFLSSYNMDVFDTKKINIIRKFYLRILNSS